MRISLEGYNKVLIAICGSLLLLMLLLGAGNLVVELIPSHSDKGILTAKEAGPSKTEQAPGPPAEPSFPEQLVGTDTRIIAMDVSSESRGRMKFSSGSGEERFCRNLIFQNTRTHESRTLFEKPTLILRREVLREASTKDHIHEEERAYGLLLEIVDSDTNQDGRINAEDASRLVFTGIDGAKVVPVSAPGDRIRSWELASAQKRVYFKKAPTAPEKQPVLMEAALPPTGAATPVLAE